MKKKYRERERTNKCFPVLTTGESAAEGHVVFTALPFLAFYELENFQTKKLKKKKNCFTDSMTLKRIWIHLKRVKRGDDNKKSKKYKASRPNQGTILNGGKIKQVHD